MKRSAATSSIGGLLVVKRASIESSSSSTTTTTVIDVVDDEPDDAVAVVASSTTLIVDSAPKPLYFLENFLAVMEHAAQHAASPAERRRTARVCPLRLAVAARAGSLCASVQSQTRLVSRQSPVYDELGSSDELLWRPPVWSTMRGWLQCMLTPATILQHNDAMNLLSRPELVRLAQAAPLVDFSKCRKAELIAKLAAWRPSALANGRNHVAELALSLLGRLRAAARCAPCRVQARRGALFRRHVARSDRGAASDDIGAHSRS
jgi:hypothetical protein